MSTSDGPVYEYDAVGTLRAVGFTSLAFYCVRPDCHAWGWVHIDKVIELHGPAASLVSLARKARCRRCKSIGAHVNVPRQDPRMGSTAIVIVPRHKQLVFVDA